MEVFSALTQSLAQAGPRDPVAEFLPILLVLFVGIGLHEYCHAKFADMAGDPTPGIHGRVTLNLFNHFDPIGGMLLIFTAWAGFGFGWGRPVPMDSRRMKNPRWDHFAAVAAGPVSNLLQAVVFGLAFRVVAQTMGIVPGTFLFNLMFFGVVTNLSLFFFNLIPFGPLDGHWLVGSFLPEDLADKWYYFNRTTGMYIFLGLILLSVTGLVPVFAFIRGPVFVAASLILGI
jgi:Zn-dependent protease